MNWPKTLGGPLTVTVLEVTALTYGCEQRGTTCTTSESSQLIDSENKKPYLGRILEGLQQPRAPEH